MSKAYETLVDHLAKLPAAVIVPLKDEAMGPTAEPRLLAQFACEAPAALQALEELHSDAIVKAFIDAAAIVRGPTECLVSQVEG